MRHHLLRVLALSAVLLGGMPAHAHGDEDHSHGPAAPAATAASAAGSPATAPGGAPRFTAASDAFELVGVLDGRRLTLWLDHAPTNAPVTAGTLDLELGDTRVQPRPEGGAWVATLAADLPPGTVTVTATVAAGGATDLLAGELVLAPAAAPSAAAAAVPRLRILAGAAGVLAVLAAAFALLRARRRAS